MSAANPVDFSQRLNLWVANTSVMQWLAKRAFNGKVRARLYYALSAKLEAGKDINASVSELLARAMEFKPGDTYTIALREIAARKRKESRSLGSALQEYAPPTECILIEAGERANKLPETLNQLVETIERQQDFLDKGRSALLLPVIALVFLLSGFSTTCYFLGHMLEQDYPGQQWTGMVALLITYSHLLGSGWLFLLVPVFLSIPVFIYWSMDNWTSRSAAEKFVPWSIYKLNQSIIFLNAMSNLLLAGTDVKQAVIQIARNAQPWLQVRLEATIYRMNMSRNLGQALREAGYEFPDHEIADQLVDISALPNMSELLSKMAARETKNAVKRLDAIVQRTLLMVLMGIIAMVLTILMLIIALTSQMGGAIK